MKTKTIIIALGLLSAAHAYSDEAAFAQSAYKAYAEATERARTLAELDQYVSAVAVEKRQKMSGEEQADALDFVKAIHKQAQGTNAAVTVNDTTATIVIKADDTENEGGKIVVTIDMVKQEDGWKVDKERVSIEDSGQGIGE